MLHGEFKRWQERSNKGRVRKGLLLRDSVFAHTHTHTHTHMHTHNRQNTHRHSGNSCSSQQSHFRPLRTSGSGCLSCSAGSCRTYGSGAGVGGLPTWRYVNDMCGMCCGVWRKPRTLHRGLLRALFVSPVSCFDSPPN